MIRIRDKGPPPTTCTLDNNGLLTIIVMDRVTGKPAAACAITLPKGDAVRLAEVMDAYCERGKCRRFVCRLPADPFDRVCRFESTGWLSVELTCGGIAQDAASAGIRIVRGDERFDQLIDGLRTFGHS